MQNSNAQKTVIVPFTEGDCDCPTPAEFIYRVDVAVVDQCGEEPVAVFEDHQFVDHSPGSIPLDRFCDNPSNEECYLVLAVVRKYCSDGHGGYIEVCWGKYEGDHYSCPYLMSSGIITLPLITIN